MRASRSWPRSSVPKGCCQDGVSRRAAKSMSLIGTDHTVPPSKMASTIAMRMTPLATARRCRLNRRQASSPGENRRPLPRTPVPTSVEGNARIEPAIEDVGDEVEEHHEAREHERHSHHDGCIVGKDRADEQRADPGNTKDLFGDDGPPEDGRYLQSHQRYNGDQCIAHDVFHDDDAFAETFSARGRDVVEADDVQHR